MDLTEAEDIKKRWQEYTEELCKIHLNDPDCHIGIHSPRARHPGMWSQPGISGGDGIPIELFQTLKDDVVKVLHSICQQI